MHTKVLKDVLPNPVASIHRGSTMMLWARQPESGDSSLGVGTTPSMIGAGWQIGLRAGGSVEQRDAEGSPRSHDETPFLVAERFDRCR